MFRNKFLSYSLPWLVGLFFFSVQGVFAGNLFDQRGRRTSSEVVESGSYQSAVFANDPSPLMLPEFESKGLYLAHYTADTPASNPATITSTAKPKAADDTSLAAKATNPIANLMQFQLQNSFIPERKHPILPMKIPKIIGKTNKSPEDFVSPIRFFAISTPNKPPNNPPIIVLVFINTKIA